MEEQKSSSDRSDDIPSGQQKTDDSQNSGSFLSFFVPREGYIITPILSYINVIIFILMALSGVSIFEPTSEQLLNWGANFRPLTSDGQAWRLLTCCFIHIGLFHLLMNMYALLYIGLLLEPLLGKLKFTAAYLLTGIAASATSLWWHDMTVSAGASGAIFGMYGVFLAMLTTNLIEKSSRMALLKSIGIFVAYNLIYGIKGNIDSAAHIGGLVTGIIMGYAFYPVLKKNDDKKMNYLTIGIFTFVILFGSFMVTRKVPNDIPTYEGKMKTFATNEEMALEIYRMPKNSPKEKYLAEIKERGLYYWNENTKLLNEMDQLDIPDVLHERNKKLIQYCDYRIRSYNLIYKTISEETNIYTDSLKYYNTEIKALLDELSVK